jgi:hypothetical protein
MEKLANHQRRKASLNLNMQAFMGALQQVQMLDKQEESAFSKLLTTQNKKSQVHKELSIARNYQCCKAL